MRTEPSDLLQKTKDTKEPNPYYKQVKKVTERNFRLLPDYEKRVKKQREKEGKNPDEFTSEGMKGKVKVANAGIANANDPNKKYLMLEFFDKIKPKIKFEYQGTTIEKQILQRWFSDRENSSQKQGVENPIKCQTPSLDNIFQVTYKGIIYELID
jgi:hypothetical protein